MSEAAVPLQLVSPPRASLLPVSFEDVTYSARGKRLLDGLNLTLEAGSTTVIMGPNGAGKSLTLRLLQGLIAPSSGRIQWAQSPDRARVGRKVATVFQRPVLLRRSVAGNLAHALKVYGVPSRLRAAQIDRWLDHAGLADLRDRAARVLSGGEQQRLSLVRALAAEPDLLLLDEPTASLDPQATLAIEALVQTAARGGTKVVMVTHDAGQARRLADDVAFLHRGQVTEHTTATLFFGAPRSRAAQAYLAGRIDF